MLNIQEDKIHIKSYQAKKKNNLYKEKINQNCPNAMTELVTLVTLMQSF